MKRWIAGVLAAVLLLGGCQSKDYYQKISAQEGKDLLDQGGIQLVDVRTQEEYQEQRIPGAVLIPLDTIGPEQPEELPDLAQPVMVYCRSGRRSKEAADKLGELGYETVYDLGGIQDWPYDTVSGEE